LKYLQKFNHLPPAFFYLPPKRSGLAEVGDLVAQMFNLAKMLIRITNAQ
jgi:hypothetical protein